MRAIDLEELQHAETDGRKLIDQFDLESWHGSPPAGTTQWTIQTGELLRDCLGNSPLFRSFVSANAGRVVAQGLPHIVSALGKKRTFEAKVEVVAAIVRTVQRRTRDGRPPRDPLLEARQLSGDLGIEGVSSYLDDAVEALAGEKWEEAAALAAKALEKAVYGLADLVVDNKASRGGFSPALKLLADREIIAEDTFKALSVRDVSLWGWVCLKGRHAEGVGAGHPAANYDEAQFALDWVSSALILLFNSYEAWRSRENG